MPKYLFKVSGLTKDDVKFSTTCVETDIIKAINQFRDISVSVHSIERVEQVRADTLIGIRAVELSTKCDNKPVWMKTVVENIMKCPKCGKYASKVPVLNDNKFDYIYCPYCKERLSW